MRLIKHSKSQMVFEGRNSVGIIIGIGFLVITGPVALGMIVATLAQFLGLTIHGHPIQDEGEGPPIWSGIPCVLFFVVIGLGMLLYSTHTEVIILDKSLGVVKTERRRLVGRKVQEIPLGDIVEVGNHTNAGDSDFATTYWVVLKCSSGQEFLINDLDGRGQAPQLELADTLRAFLRLRPSSTHDDPGQLEPS